VPDPRERPAVGGAHPPRLAVALDRLRGVRVAGAFGSSLAPLFLGPYERVVLIDLRYIDSRILTNFVQFEQGADVLFLYSSQILNSPATLLVT